MRSFKDYHQVREIFCTDVPVHWETALEQNQPHYTALFTIPYQTNEQCQPVSIVYKAIFTGNPMDESEDSPWFYSLSFAPDDYNTDKANPEWPSAETHKMFTGYMGYARRNLGTDFLAKMSSALLETIGNFLNTKKPAVLTYNADLGMDKMYRSLVYKLSSEYPDYGFVDGNFVRKDLADHHLVKSELGWHSDEPILFERIHKPR